jgi:hypothetical protein
MRSVVDWTITMMLTSVRVELVGSVMETTLRLQDSAGEAVRPQMVKVQI